MAWVLRTHDLKPAAWVAEPSHENIDAFHGASIVAGWPAANPHPRIIVFFKSWFIFMVSLDPQTFPEHHYPKAWPPEATMSTFFPGKCTQLWLGSLWT
ncbi:hypothetical protein D8674_020317 [Pyrus ussuriensis x Pyrus communis]|uniref:Uncharacterized protein n=1 Tax=Pyrus ussuriensis x Pyrus communis TaxID=2448454 RepID=A0A5N5HFB4_9ROSA|nr:hypothetical protein D8674_020317 [Pyrus ussuriensis x Pyrus communis]